MPFLPRPCAEFPNDNPDLHDGASWVCGWTRAQPRAVLSARGTARLGAAPPQSAPFETITASSPAPIDVNAASALPSLDGLERTDLPLESDVRLVVPETEASTQAADAAAAQDCGAQDTAETVKDTADGAQDTAETVKDAVDGVQDTAEPAHGVDASVTDVESYFAELDRRLCAETPEPKARAAQTRQVESSVALTRPPAGGRFDTETESRDLALRGRSSRPSPDSGAAAEPRPGTTFRSASSAEDTETSATEQDAPTTFALVCEPFAPMPDVVDRSAPLATTGPDTGTAPLARDAFTPKDRQDLETAFGRFLGIDADEPSEDLSALISATREPVQTAVRAMTSDGSPAEGRVCQLELDLTAGTKQLTLTLDTPNSSAAPGALSQALVSLDDAFDEAIEFTPSAPAAEVAASELAGDAKVAIGDEKALEAVAPPALEPIDIQMMHAALAAFDEPIEFTPSAPVAESDESVELTPSAAMAEALARPQAGGWIDTETAEAEHANADAELRAEPVVDEGVPEQEEAIVDAVAALDELFDTDGSDWQTPVSQLAVGPTTLDPVAVRDVPARREDEVSLERATLELANQAEPLDDPEADIATRRLVLAEDDEDDEEETVSLSAARADERGTDNASPSVNPAGVSGSFRVPRPEAFDEETDEDQGHASLEPLSLELTPPPPGVGGWDRLADFVAGFLLVRSATRAAALLPELLEGKRVNLSRLPEDTIAALCAEGIAERRPDGTFPTAAFRQQANALHLDFMSGRAPTRDLIQWLSVAVRALLGNTVSAAAAYAHLEQAGITKLLQRAA